MQLQTLAAKGQMTPTRLYLVRHGQVADGHTDRYHGRNDVDLSPTGVRQFEDLAAHLREVRFEGLYASELRRTRIGAEIIGRGRDLPVESRGDFNELNFGHWEGLSFAEISSRYPEELAGRLEDLVNFRIPGGESLADVRARVLPCLQELLLQHAGGTILLVAHAGINRVILCQALGLSMQEIFRLDQAYAGVNIIDYFADFTVVRLLNGTFTKLPS